MDVTRWFSTRSSLSVQGHPRATPCVSWRITRQSDADDVGMLTHATCLRWCSTRLLRRTAVRHPDL